MLVGGGEWYSCRTQSSAPQLGCDLLTLELGDRPWRAVRAGDTAGTGIGHWCGTEHAWLTLTDAGGVPCARRLLHEAIWGTEKGLEEGLE